ncbi:MAG: PAS domain-containing protein, partial [Actinomycetes bacterium]
MVDSAEGSSPLPLEAEGEPAADASTDFVRQRDILAQAQYLAKIGAWEWDSDSRTLWWSDEVYRILGYQPHEFVPTLDRFVENVHPDDRPELRRNIEAALAGIEDHDVRHRIVWPDGALRYVHERATVIRDGDGRLARMLGTVMDVTEETLLQIERDDALRSLAESEERYRLLAENAWDVIWTMGLDGTVTYVSPSVERVRGLTPAEAAAQTPEQMQPPESLA